MTALATVVLTALVALVVMTDRAEARGPLMLIDVETGRILYAENPHQRWHPASLTKVMTAYLAFEAIRDGRLSMETQLVTSKTANKMPPSKIGLPVGAKMSMELALKSLIIKSANDVAVMFAETIDGSVAAFTDRMNRTARRLGMTRTRFVNPNGLPAGEQVTTAADLARLARAVMLEYPEHAHFWATRTMRIGRVRLRSHNTLIGAFPGATGLKTGFICDAGFNIVASAKRNGRHLAAIVLGEVTPQDRAARAASLLEHGFDTYAWKLFLRAPQLDGYRPAEGQDLAAPSIRSRIRVWDCRRRPVKRRVKQTSVSRPSTAPAQAQPRVPSQRRANERSPLTTAR